MKSMRFFGLKTSPETRLDAGLSSLYGINRRTALTICRKVGILPSATLGSLEEAHVLAISSFRKSYPYGGALRARLRNQAVQGLRTGEVRYLRQRQGLPSRGQRTRTNAKTAKRENRKRFKRS